MQDKILIIDIEATCWQETPPPGQQSEIIEIGACLLNVVTGQIEGKRSILVKPTRSKVSPFCTQLTTLTQEQVEEGILFSQACTILETDYSSKQRVWASYGDYDRRQFESQCASFGVPYPFGAEHINIKKLFAAQTNWKKQVGMAQALKKLNLPLEGTHHRGHDDAWNIARILAVLMGLPTAH